MASLTDDPRAFARAVPETMPARITRLSKEVAEASHALEGARQAFEKADRLRDECSTQFMHLSNELMQAIHEHREGTPENVPYQS